MIAFIQSFGLRERVGGARILRSLLDCPHPQALSVTTVQPRPSVALPIEEIVLPIRPWLGKLESARFAYKFNALDKYFSPQFERKLTKLLRERDVRLIHLVAHGYEVIPTLNVAEKLGIPFYLSVHDDCEYVNQKNPLCEEILEGISRAWKQARGIFTISNEIGDEYSRRYGKREFVTVTDGLAEFATGALARPEKSLRIYFMGLFHFSYYPNLKAFLDCLKIVRSELPDWKIDFTARCGQIHMKLDEDVRVLTYATEREVESDLLNADLLYMPMPFAETAQNFSRFSLSTKLVTYLGSGIPILFHGPEDAAANRLLEDANAAIRVNTNEPQMMAKILLDGLKSRNDVAENALKLAREKFDLKAQQKRFWSALSERS